MNNEKLLVTGGAGFIGSHVSEALLKHGYHVRILDNLSLGKKEWLPKSSNVEFYEGDICSVKDCERACDGVSAVFHLAAMSKVAPSISDPTMVTYCTEQNVIGTLNILNAARKSEVRKVIYSASSTVYGNSPTPHQEDANPNCLSPYALTKYIGEQYCAFFDKMYNLPTISLRYFQVCGPRQPNTGAYAVVAGIFFKQKKDGKPLTIHGDGSQCRDFVHVKDVAKANVLAFESNARNIIINIGTGQSYSIKELADRISNNQVMGLPRRAGDSEATLADIDRCRQILHWVPSITFDEIVEEMLNSEIEREN